MSERVSPYTRLQREFRQWASGVVWPKRRSMVVYPADKVEARHGYRLDDLAYRVQAAKTLGFDVVVEWDPSSGLVFSYVEKRPDDMPWSLR